MQRIEPWLPDGVPVEVGGATIQTYLLDSDGAGDLVICHGTPWSALTWAGVARSLADIRRVYLWDMPGYGQSTMSADVPVDLPSQMRRFAQLLDRWGLVKPAVVAHDIGGAVALGAHLTHGREFERLYLFDIVTLDPWGSAFFRLVAEHAAVFSALPPALHAALVREYISGATNGRLNERWVEALTKPWTTEAGQPAFYRQISQLHPADTRPIAQNLHRVACPVAIGWGQADPWIPVEQARRLADALPYAPPVAELPGVAHLPPVEAPAEATRLLRDWLE